ncbi:MAG: flagellar filament capping protein FliD [Desulfobacteraceae bacterium]|nr:flagellar filament capping protein FliD [Desulfobacteraceae bacterium]
MINTDYNYLNSNYLYINYLNNAQNAGVNNSSDLLSLVENAASQTFSLNQMYQQQSIMLSQALNNLGTYTAQLYQASYPLIPDSYPGANTSVFDNVAATSSNPNQVTATAQPGATIATYSVYINQLASAQLNQGAALSSNSITTASTGTDTFNLQINGTTTPISVNVNNTDTNQTFLNNMAQAINTANIGVTASVITNSQNSTSQLEIIANNTGTSNNFSLTDITGNAVSVSSTNNIINYASNASYTINNQAYTSGSNTINIDNNNLQLNLLNTTSSFVTINVTNDQQAINNTINNFVNNYNAMINFLQQNNAYIDQGIFNNMTNIINSQVANLQSIGITQNNDNTLSVNQTQLSSALTNNTNQVQNIMSGIATNIISITQEIQSSSITNYINNQTSSFINNLNNNINQYSYKLYNYLATIENSLLVANLMPVGGLLNTIL